MSRQTIDGRLYSKMLEGGAASLALHVQEINDLNVFPVADGDTGTNMARTVNGGVSAISSNESEDISNKKTKTRYFRRYYCGYFFI